MKKEGVFHTLCVFLRKNRKVFDILTFYKHYGLPLAILSLLRQPILYYLNRSENMLFQVSLVILWRVGFCISLTYCVGVQPSSRLNTTEK